MSDRIIRLGLLGLGTVGSELLRLVRQNGDRIAERSGLRPVVTKVAVAHPDKTRATPMPDDLLAADGEAVVADEDVDVVVELMGGIDPARSYIARALSLHKPVVTANKQLLAAHGPELMQSAAAAGVRLGYEGAVGASIPLIKPLRESLAADRILSLKGILNGTTNYILTRMTEDGWTFADALAAAQRRGFAEANPDEDVAGHDAAAKLAILATAAFDARVTVDQIYREGISRITPRDIVYARQLGYVVKLLAVAEDRGTGLDCRVHPVLLPQTHLLASVRDERNAVLVTGEAAGAVLLSGPGAGGRPTAAIVLGDILDVVADGPGFGPRQPAPSLRERALRPVGDLVAPVYFSLQVIDRPGVFARVAAVFGEEQVSIASIVQQSRGETADVVLMTHEARGAAIERVTARLRGMDVVPEIGAVIRVEQT